MTFEKEMKAHARKHGADLIGISSINRFSNAPSEYHPRRVLPDAQSVVVVGIRILRGVIQTLKHHVAYLPYVMFGHGWLSNYVINIAGHQVARFVEDQGFEAVLIPWPCEEHRLQHLAEAKSNIKKTKQPGLIMKGWWPKESFISFKYAGAAAGLGEIGWNRLLLTPHFGPRQRLVVIITNAPLEPDVMFEGRLCDPGDCGYRCVDKCPANALSRDECVSIEIGEKQYMCSDFDELRCAWVVGGFSKETCRFAPLDMQIPPKLTASSLLKHRERFYKLTPEYRGMQRVATTSSGLCGRCLMACASYLEETKRITNLSKKSQLRSI